MAHSPDCSCSAVPSANSVPAGVPIYVILWAVIPLGTAKKPLDSNTIDAEFEVKE